MQMNEVRISCYDSSVEVEITLRLSPFRAVLSTGASGLGIPACLPEKRDCGVRFFCLRPLVSDEILSP